MKMSSYTLELRHIHQTYKVFNFDYDFYVDSDIIKSKFEQKFIDEYYFHEIGQETVARFQHRLRTRLNKIMPYYKQLYDTEIAAKDINFLLNKDLTETFERVVTGESSSINDLTVSDQGETNNKESNIENGNASLELENGSLTNVSKTSLNNNTNSNNTSRDNTNQNEITTLKSRGNIGITSSAELLDKWRSVIINIDQMIINSCDDLFMQVY
nr:MAG TPA: Lower collar protein [Caudoviricetes sp.]